MTTNISELTRSFLFSAIDHACNDAKTPFQTVSSKYEQWKQAMMDKRDKEQSMDEKYIINYLNKRNEYEEIYQQWYTQRNEIIKNIKNTDIIGAQESLLSDLSKIPLPDILHTPVPDVYTKYLPKPLGTPADISDNHSV